MFQAKRFPKESKRNVIIQQIRALVLMSLTIFTHFVQNSSCSYRARLQAVERVDRLVNEIYRALLFFPSYLNVPMYEYTDKGKEEYLK